MNIKLLLLASLLIVSGVSFGQKQKYSKEETKELKTYYFDEGFTMPARKKTSTLIMKDGSEIKGNISNFKSKRMMMNIIILSDKTEYDAKDIKEAYIFASGFEQFGKKNDQINSAGTKRKSASKKDTENDELYFASRAVSIQNKKEPIDVLLQLINSSFDDYISIYFDPSARESSGTSIGGVTLGGGVLKSYYIEKDGKVVWLSKKNFKDQYNFMFGDSPEFMAKYPFGSINWDWLSGLVLEYSKMRLASEG